MKGIKDYLFFTKVIATYYPIAVMNGDMPYES